MFTDVIPYFLLICGIFICLSLFSSVIIINPYFIAVAIRNASPEDVPLFPVNSIIFGFSVTIFLTLFWMSSSISRTVHCWEKIHSLISLSFISSNISEQVTIEWELQFYFLYYCVVQIVSLLCAVAISLVFVQSTQFRYLSFHA